MATQSFATAQTFNDQPLTPTAAWNPPGNPTSIRSIVSTGPMPDPLMHVQVFVELSQDNGATWTVRGGLECWGGMSASVKGGPADTPAQYTGEVQMAPVSAGNRVRAEILVEHGPVILSASAVTA